MIKFKDIHVELSTDNNDIDAIRELVTWRNTAKVDCIIHFNYGITRGRLMPNENAIPVVHRFIDAKYAQMTGKYQKRKQKDKEAST